MKSIAVLGEAVYGWGGGADLLLDFGKALDYAKKEMDPKLNLFLLLPHEPQWGCFLNSLSEWIHYRGKTKFNINQYKSNRKQLALVVSNFQNMCPNFEIKFYRRIRFWKIDNKQKDLQRVLNKLKIEVAFPALYYKGEILKTPNMTYIPDFQHKYMPELFPEEEKKWLAWQFENQVKDSKYILVTSEDTVNDINKFYPQHKSKIFALPFCPMCDENWIRKSQETDIKYKLPKNYFIISNQFWQHKSHITAFKALEILFLEGKHDMHIVCTGKMEDYRDMRYVERLLEDIAGYSCRKNIHLLGYIPKADQMQIMKLSRGLIQMSLYEGNPGGNCVLDGISVGIPCIISDIPINHEIRGFPPEEVIFFKAKDSYDLAKKMLYIWENGHKCEDENALLSKMRENKSKLAERLLNVLLEVINNYKVMEKWFF